MRPPRPMEVKKLMAKRVLRGLSRGKRPSKYPIRVLKAKNTFSLNKEEVRVNKKTHVK